ncbi:MAG: hypothetical protein IKD93_01760 [Firmicutes bacterium]|nr:hypothetical protein [Bacillota bacterium]
MKKLWPVILLLALALTLGLAACRQQDEPEAEAEPAAEAAAEDKEEAAKEDEQQPEILPPELVGSWRLEGDPAASLEIAADGTVSFFMSSGHDGAGSITMEQGKAVAHTVSYLEGVAESFVLTPDKDGERVLIRMELEGRTELWQPASGAADPQQEAAATARVDEDFTRRLDEIRSRVQVGSAAAYMSAVAQAAALLDWAEGTEMGSADILTAFAAYFGGLDNQAKAALLLQLELVDGACGQLREDGQEELLSSAGVRESGYPWSDGAFAAADALMTAAGLR